LPLKTILSLVSGKADDTPETVSASVDAVVSIDIPGEFFRRVKEVLS
jgi:hypothetical protein